VNNIVKTDSDVYIIHSFGLERVINIFSKDPTWTQVDKKYD